MLKYICKKLVFLVVLLLLISIVVFVAIRLVPGDPVVAMLGSEVAGMSEEYLEYERERLGLNDPMYVQYFNYMKDLFRGDLGVSIRTDQPVIEIILDRYPVTIKIALLSIGLATLFGVILGIISAVKHNSVLDYIISTTSMLSISTPSFFLALVLLLVFALKLKVLPSMGLSSSLHYVLPVVTISVMELGYVARDNQKLHAGCNHPGLHQDGAGKRRAGAHRILCAGPEKRPDPHRNHHRLKVRFPAGRLLHRGDGV